MTRLLNRPLSQKNQNLFLYFACRCIFGCLFFKSKTYNYFINSAFPTEAEMNELVDVITKIPGSKMSELERAINMKQSRIKLCIKYLLVNGDIYKDGSAYYKTPKVWKADFERSSKITEIRKNELEEMNQFADIKDCYMKYIANILDDTETKDCGCCANCLGHNIFDAQVNPDDVMKVQMFVKKDFNVIEPRKKWPNGVRMENKNSIGDERRCESGLVLSNYGGAGWGKHIAECKYKKGTFDDKLVEAAVELLKDFVVQNDIQWVTNISSLRRPELVKTFAEKVAEKLGLPYQESIIKTSDVKCQKEYNSSRLQYENAVGSFEVSNVLSGNVLLIDDMVDSRWTFTVCGYKLRENGCGKVYPFALANTANRNEEGGV